MAYPVFEMIVFPIGIKAALIKNFGTPEFELIKSTI